VFVGIGVGIGVGVGDSVGVGVGLLVTVGVGVGDSVGVGVGLLVTVGVGVGVRVGEGVFVGVGSGVLVGICSIIVFVVILTFLLFILVKRKFLSDGNLKLKSDSIIIKTLFLLGLLAFLTIRSILSIYKQY
jgi:hypothetical protein